MRITKKKIEGVFTEWDRRYRKNPERFMTEVEHLLNETPCSYGKACALYFEKLAKEI